MRQLTIQVLVAVAMIMATVPVAITFLPFARAQTTSASIDNRDKAMSFAKNEGDRYVRRAEVAVVRAKGAAAASRPLAESLNTSDSQRQIQVAEFAAKEAETALGDALSRAERAIKRVEAVRFFWDHSDTEAMNVELNLGKEAADKAEVAAKKAEGAKTLLDSLIARKKEEEGKAWIARQKELEEKSVRDAQAQSPAPIAAPAPTSPRESPVATAINAERAVSANGKDVEQVLRSASQYWSQMQATSNTALGESLRGRIEGLERQAQQLHARAQAELAALPKPKTSKKPTQEVAAFAEAHGRVSTATQRVAGLSHLVSNIADKARAWKPPTPSFAGVQRSESTAPNSDSRLPMPDSIVKVDRAKGEADAIGPWLWALGALAITVLGALVYRLNLVRTNRKSISLLADISTRKQSAELLRLVQEVSDIRSVILHLRRDVDAIRLSIDIGSRSSPAPAEIAFPPAFPDAGTSSSPVPELPVPKPMSSNDFLMEHVGAAKHALAEPRRGAALGRLIGERKGEIDAEIVLPAPDGWRLAAVYAVADRDKGMIVPFLPSPLSVVSDWFVAEGDGEVVVAMLRPARGLRDRAAERGWRVTQRGEVRCAA